MRHYTRTTDVAILINLRLLDSLCGQTPRETWFEAARGLFPNHCVLLKEPIVEINIGQLELVSGALAGSIKAP